MNNKKSQITIFVIMGIMILLAIGLFLFLQITKTENKPQVPIQPLSEEVMPIKKFVESCINEVTKKALTQIGKHAGYVNVPSGLKVSPIEYESDVFYNDIYNMPYWYYLNSEGDFVSHRPNLCSYTSYCGINDYGEISIQENIEDYILDNLDRCINNFEQFENIFEIKPKSEKKILTHIINDSVITNLNYKLEITPLDKEDTLIVLENFQTEINVPLLQMFQLATTITEGESKYNFLEYNTLNLISAYTRLDNNYLPPMAEMVFFDFNKNFWIQSKIKDQLRYEILPYMGLTKLTNAYGIRTPIPLVDDEYMAFALGYYDSFMTKLDKDNTTYNYEVRFYYPDSDIFLQIDGGKELIEPKVTEGPSEQIMKMFKMVVQDYTFNYDISYPIIVEIEDYNAFNGEGYTFSFPLEVNIRDNLAYSQNMTFVSLGRIASININDPSQLVNKTLEIIVSDKHTDEPINEAQISYYCGSDYYIGKTNIKDSEASFIGKLPYCAAGGYIEVRKDNYHTERHLFNNDESDLSSETIDIEMWPIKNKTIGFFIRTEQDISELDTIYEKLEKKHELKDSQTLMFNIKKIKDYAIEEDFPLVGFKAVAKENNSGFVSGIETQKNSIKDLYNAGHINRSMYDSLIEQLEQQELEETEPTTLSSTITNIDLIPGTYSVDMTIMEKGPFEIPEKTDEICILELSVTGICLDSEEIVYNATNFSVWITGKAEFNFTIGENYVYNDKIINFFTPTIDSPETWDDIIDKDLDTYIEENVDTWMMLPYYE